MFVAASSLRQQIRISRRALSVSQRHQAALELFDRVVTLPIFISSRRVAGYLAVDAEMDPAPLLTHALEEDKKVYLPVLTDDPRTPMAFAPYRLDTTLKPNRFGILEPDSPMIEWLQPQQLDLVLTPLVGFDAKGTRLGMGGGFYDRTFSFRRDAARPQPYLLGLAYELQKVEELIPQPWDIPLDAIATEQALYTSAVSKQL